MRPSARWSLLAVALSVGFWSCTQPGGSDRETLTILAPAAPGGGWDQTSRAMQQVLRDTGLAPSVQVVNVPGAGGVIGLAQLVETNQGDPNILMTTGLIMVGAILTNDSPVTLAEVTPVARITGEYEVLVVPADSPYQTLAEFVDAWKESPGDLAIAGGSAGGTDHMVAGLLANAVGVDVHRINYLPHSGGGESMASLLGGHVAGGINGYAELEPFIEAGSLRPLGISSEERLAHVDIPTFLEQGVDVSLANWRAVAAAPGITSDQRADLVSLLDGMHASEKWKAALERNRWIDMYMTGPDLDDFLERENTRVTGVLRSIGLVE